jgi:hypothetical protein
MTNHFISFIKRILTKNLNQVIVLLFLLALTTVSCEKKLPSAPGEN